jgi:hypothetical protein
MLAQLSSLKARLSIPDTDPQYDDLLTSVLEALSARFDAETNRTLARTVDATFEFDPADTEISPPLYPIESVSKFELKTTEAEGWFEATDVAHLIRRGCIISLPSPLSTINSQPSTCRVTYTGGYVLPGDTPAPGQTPLPPDLEPACIEQAAASFLRRDMLGLDTSWPKGGILQRFSKLDLLLPVQQVLSRYRRWSI